VAHRDRIVDRAAGAGRSSLTRRASARQPDRVEPQAQRRSGALHPTEQGHQLRSRPSRPRHRDAGRRCNRTRGWGQSAHELRKRLRRPPGCGGSRAGPALLRGAGERRVGRSATCTTS
jgi:hypothetical protein